MFLQEILEVAIGLVFMWLVLSIATMQILEWARTLSKKRATDLQKAIRDMLADPGLAERFYDHPLIRNLYTGRRGQKPPSYIPYKQFSMVLFDIVTTAGTEASFLRKQLQGIKDEIGTFEIKEETQDPQKKAAFIDRVKAVFARNATRRAIREGLEAILGKAREAAARPEGSAALEAARAALTEEVMQFAARYEATVPDLSAKLYQVFEGARKQIEALKNHEPSENDSETFQKIGKGVLALSNLSPELSKTVKTLVLGLDASLGKSEEALAEARSRAEAWFNGTMDRLSGSLKRNSMAWSFVIGILLAGAMNVDSIQIATQLWREPAVRQVLVEKASAFELNLPAAESAEDAGEQDPAAPAEAGQQAAATPTEAMQEFRAQFEGLNLPIGWGFAPVEAATCAWRPSGEGQVFGIFFEKDVDFWFIHIESGCYQPAAVAPETNGAAWAGLKVVGILISALATVQGAPFWFDLLSKLINVRGTGAKPEEKKADAAAK